jgi:hypothetical protein
MTSSDIEYYQGKIRFLRRKIAGLNSWKGNLSRVSVLGIIDDLFDEVDFDRKLEDAGDLEVKGLVRKNGG